MPNWAGNHAPEWLYTLIGISGAAWILRAFALLGPGGPLAFHIDYDEGVYFSASALLMQGTLPYRDFIFVHPPGVLYALGLSTSWLGFLDPAPAFVVARFIATFIGGVNTFLVGKLAWRWAGPVAGLWAAAFYATYTEAITVERGAFIEPFLNLLCLVSALFWLRRDSTPSSRLSFGVGLILGAAFSMKVLAGIWVLASVLTLPRERRFRSLAWMLFGTATMAVVLVAPLATFDLRSFLDNVVLFHARRPLDGVTGIFVRFEAMVARSHWIATALGLVALVTGVRALNRSWAYFASVYALTIAAFLTAKSYWLQYNAFLAPAACILAGVGATELIRRLSGIAPPRFARAIAPAMAGLIFLPQVRRLLFDERPRAFEQVVLAQEIRALPPKECIYTFEPAWSVIGGKLPQGTVDPYAAMLMEATQEGQRFAFAKAAFQHPSSQKGVRGVLSRCRFVALGQRGDLQLSPETQDWFRARFVKRFPPEGTSGIDVWEQMP